MGWIFVVIFCLTSVCYAQRIPGSPYPVPSDGFNRTTRIFVVFPASSDDGLSSAVLAGLLARSSSGIGIFVDSGSVSDALWLDSIQKNWNVKLYRVAFSDVLSQLRHLVKGYVLCNLEQNNGALTFISSQEQLFVLATPKNEATFVKFNISMQHDARQWNVTYVLDHFGGKFSNRIVSLQNPAKLCLADYSVFASAVSWFEKNVQDPLSKRIFAMLQPNSAVMGWGLDEGQTVAQVSAYSSFVHASDYARNMATMTGFDMSFVPKKTWKIPRNKNRSSGNTVSFLMTDGDNIQWLLNDFATDPKWYGSPLRGETEIGWTMSPALIELAAPAAYHIFNNATEKDSFVCAPSGLGYTNPDIWESSKLAQFASLTAKYMKKCGMKHLNVIGEKYSNVSAGVLLNQEEIESVLWYDYSSYSALKGSISFVNKKPVIGARYQLWNGVFENVTSLIEKLNSQPLNSPSQASSYSLVAVHVWTNTVEDVLNVVKGLKQGITVVSINEFVKRVQQNIGISAIS